MIWTEPRYPAAGHAPDPDAGRAFWMEIMSGVIEAPFPAEGRVEALLDRIERGPRPLREPGR